MDRKQLLDKSDAGTQHLSHEEIDEEASYTPEALTKAWMDFSQQLHDDIHLTNGMKTSPPRLLNGHSFEVVVTNPVLQKKLEELKYTIERHLRRAVKNRNIQLSIRLDESETSSRPFTARDRFDVLSKKNPALLDFYRLFGLDLD